MNYTAIVSSAALQDIEQAVFWYEKKLEGLGEKIVESFYESVLVLEDNPKLFEKKYNEVRIKYITRFPYGIHYMIQKDTVKIIAFFHMKRDPIRWENRLREEENS